MLQQTTAQRLAIQNLLNAYCFELQCTKLVTPDDQSKEFKQLSSGQVLLELKLNPAETLMVVPIETVSLLGQHRYSDTPWVRLNGQWVKPSVVTCASMILEDIAYQHQHNETVKKLMYGEAYPVDPKGVLKRWIQSYQGLECILECRSDEIDDIVEAELDFIETEQNLIYGHAMHPTPKGREGFHPDEWARYAPETQSKFKLTFWLVAPENIEEEFEDGESITAELASKLKGALSGYQQGMLDKYPSYKLLPLHPWQARFLQTQPWYTSLCEQDKLHSLGELGWALYPTTSVRTLASFDAPWMFKTSLSVAITNSVRINLKKECKRGLHACRIWRSDYGKQLSELYPSVAVLNDPAWIALKVDGNVIDETICILRDNPFTKNIQVTNLASLCQDHPTRLTNRFDTLFRSIAKRTSQDLSEIAHDWFERYLQFGFIPLIDLYYQQGIGFEVHQQNSLIELEDGYPSRFWARDNQGFGYIAEYAMALIDGTPELIEEAECVVPEDFADQRCAYYLVGNSIFGLITAIARTGVVTEEQLLKRFAHCLQNLEERYPNRSLFDLLLRSPTLPFKGNLLTRMCALDELRAPVESQSVYVNIDNPIRQYA